MQGHVLYIPFWLYSNIDGTEYNITKLDFTFHSGYIPIALLLSLLAVIPSFTFHSGYIPIVPTEDVPDALKLYIPFWLYSNFTACPSAPSAPYFTFHSGYIPISMPARKHNTSSTLHSILVIFQSQVSC